MENVSLTMVASAAVGEVDVAFSPSSSPGGGVGGVAGQRISQTTWLWAKYSPNARCSAHTQTYTHDKLNPSCFDLSFLLLLLFLEKDSSSSSERANKRKWRRGWEGKKRYAIVRRRQ